MWTGFLLLYNFYGHMPAKFDISVLWPLTSDQELVASYKIIVQGAKWYKRILEKIQTTTSQQQRRHQWRSGDGVSEQNWCKQCQHDPAGGDCHSECGHWRWWERSELQCSVQRLALLKIAWRRHYTLGMNLSLPRLCYNSKTIFDDTFIISQLFTELNIYKICALSLLSLSHYKVCQPRMHLSEES